nr:MAG TPA: hypothetical protein [Caudoviricetes sp.]
MTVKSSPTLTPQILTSPSASGSRAASQVRN